MKIWYKLCSLWLQNTLPLFQWSLPPAVSVHHLTQTNCAFLNIPFIGYLIISYDRIDVFVSLIDRVTNFLNPLVFKEIVKFHLMNFKHL